jgi:hypothetical protein
MVLLYGNINMQRARRKNIQKCYVCSETRADPTEVKQSIGNGRNEYIFGGVYFATLSVASYWEFPE